MLFRSRRNAGQGGFGLLSAMDCLAFDWFRETLVTPTDAPWSAQTPVLRLYVWDPNTNTENQLVWEAFYNNGGADKVVAAAARLGLWPPSEEQAACFAGAVDAVARRERDA